MLVAQLEKKLVGIEAVGELAASQLVEMVLLLCSYIPYLVEAAAASFCRSQESPNNVEDE